MYIKFFEFIETFQDMYNFELKTLFKNRAEINVLRVQILHIAIKIL